MLSVFPDLFAFRLVAPILLRFALSVALFHTALRLNEDDGEEKNRGGQRIDKWLAVGLGVLGFFFFAGFLVQPAGLITAAAAAIGQKIKWPKGHPLRQNPDLYTLVTAASLALIFLGAGFWAIDLPL